jgi:transposase
MKIHYAMDRPEGRPCGNGKIGVDKGYTEALVDSDGVHYGTEFGAILRDYTDKVHHTGKARNKLRALDKAHRAAGRIGKADQIALNNLGTKKLAARRRKAQARLRTDAFKAVHAVVDKANIVGSEDLTSPIARKKPWKGFNRRMGFWAKGVLAEALETVTEHRHAKHVLVNSAYTSQTDPQTRGLTGRRDGDLFYCASGDVLQADYVGALNVLDRIDDTEITRFMPHDEVRRILLRRSPADCPPRGSSCGATKHHQPTAEI